MFTTIHFCSETSLRETENSSFPIGWYFHSIFPKIILLLKLSSEKANARKSIAGWEQLGRPLQSDCNQYEMPWQGSMGAVLANTSMAALP